MAADRIFAIISVILISIILRCVHGRPLFDPQEIIATITQKGQVFDCVDFYKQPAFSHPLLKNLTQTSSSLSWIQERSTTIRVGGGCPIETVPILRVGVNAFERPPPPQPTPQENCSAVVRTRANDPNKNFLGSDATITVYKAKVQPSQWSAARIRLLNGPDSIEGGWMVSPSLFNDDEAHLYARFIVDRKECINTLCPGFVQVSKDVPLGTMPEKYSITGQEQHSWNISIDKHSDDGNWWLSIGPEKHLVGYWPKTLFTALAEVASQVEWGGEINNPGPTSPIPDMGNGLMADYDTKLSSYLEHVTVVDPNFQNVEPQDTEKSSSCPRLYSVLDAGYTGADFGRLMFFGGGQPD